MGVLATSWPGRLCRVFLCAWILAATAAQGLGAESPDFGAGPLAIPADSLRAWAEEEQRQRKAAGESGGSLVLLSRTDVTVRKDGALTVRNWTISLLQTQEAVRESIRLESGWSPWQSDRPELAARILQADGREIQLDDSQAIEQAVGGESRDTIDDTRQLVMLLVGLRVGAIVETVETTEYRSFLPNSFVQSYLLAGFSPIAVSQLAVNAEPGATFHWELLGGDFAPKTARRSADSSGYAELVFEVAPAKGIFDYWQPSSGPDHSPLPLVRVGVPSRWDKVATAYLQMVAPQIAEARAVAELLTADIDRGASDQEKVDRCLERLRQTVVYTGVEFGINRIIPYTAEEIVSRGFGDCKDQSMLLVAMLQSLGLDAQMVLLNSGSGLDVSPVFPAISGFNHMIVRTDGETPLWMDPTAVGLPSGLLPAECCNRRCLVIDEQTTELGLTPPMKPADDGFFARTEFTVDSSGFGTVTRTMRYERIAALRILAGAPEDRHSDALDAHMAELFDATAENTSTDWDEQNGGTLRVTAGSDPRQIADSSETRTAYAYDLRSVLMSIPAALLSPTAAAALQGESAPATPRQNPASETISRTNPVVVNSAYEQRHEFVISYPSFLNASPLPAGFHQQIGPVTIRFDASINPVPTAGRMQLVISCEVVVDPSAGPVQAEELEQLQAQLEKFAVDASPLSGLIVLADLESPEWFRRGPVAAVTGLAQRCKAHPDDAYALARLSAALEAAKLVTAAKTKARAAMAIAPDSPLVLQVVGPILLLGDDGTIAGIGLDSEAARDIARRYHADHPVDPSHLNFVLAFLLDRRGLRETEPAHLERAVAMLRPLVESQQIAREHRDEAALRLINLLLLQRRDQEMIELLHGLSSQSSDAVEGLKLLVAAMQDEDLASWLEQHRGAGQGSENDARIVSLGCTFATSAGRFDLFEKLVTELKQKGLEKTLPAWHTSLELDRPPTELDESSPVSVARIGLARFLAGDADDLYWQAAGGTASTRPIDSASSSAHSPRAGVDTQPRDTFMRALSSNASNWTPDALRTLIDKTVIIDQTEVLGGHRLAFTNLLGLKHEPTIYAVPLEEGHYRWFFATDRHALIDWAERLIDSKRYDQVREVLDRMADLAGPLPWFNQFGGSPAARAWPMLRNSGNEGIELAVALFALEFIPHADATAQAAEAVESASEQQEYAKIHTQLWRSLGHYYSLTGDSNHEYETYQRVLRKYPDQYVYFGPLAGAARRTGRGDECKAFFEQIAPSQSPVSKQLSELAWSTQFDPFDVVLVQYDQIGEDLQSYKESIANDIAWTALLRNAEPKWLPEFIERLRPMIRIDRQPDAAHTLACLQAAAAQHEEAYETLRDAGWLEGPTRRGQLYALGAFCQAVGLDDVARDYYRRSADEFSTTSSGALARMRLEER